MKQPLFRPRKKPSLRHKQRFLSLEWNQPPLISRQFSGKNDHPARGRGGGEEGDDQRVDDNRTWVWVNHERPNETCSRAVKNVSSSIRDRQFRISLLQQLYDRLLVKRNVTFLLFCELENLYFIERKNERNRYRIHVKKEKNNYFGYLYVKFSSRIHDNLDNF